MNKMVLVLVMVFALLCPAVAVIVKTTDGMKFKGTIVAYKDNYIVLEIEGNRMTIYNKLILSIDNVPFVQTVDNARPGITAQAAPPQPVPEAAAVTNPPNPPTGIVPGTSQTVSPTVMSASDTGKTRVNSAPGVVTNPGAVGIIVLDFQSGGMDRALRAQATAAFRAILQKSPGFNVVDRTKMADRLSAQYLADADCETEECINNIAKETGATLLLSGTISRVDENTIAIAAKIIDIQTGKVVFTKSETFLGDFSILSVCMEATAQKIAKGFTLQGAAVAQNIDQEKNLAESDAVALPLDARIKKTERYVTVLPLFSQNLSQDILTVLADDFRKALSETGAYEIMERVLMEEIMQEQAFQLSDACDQTTCIVQAGRIIGVSKIIAATIAVDNDKYTISARLVDVATGKDLLIGSEERSGEAYPTAKRILTNLASVLAQKPNADHLEYVKEYEKQKARKQILEARLAKRFHINLAIEGLFPVYISQRNPNQLERESFKQYDQLENIETPYIKTYSDNVDPGINIELGLRVSRTTFINSYFNLIKTSWKENDYRLYYTNELSISTNTGTTRLYGPFLYDFTYWDSWSQYLAGLGIQQIVFQKHNYNISFYLAPHYCFTQFDTKAKDHFDSDYNWESTDQYGNSVILGKQRLEGITSYTTHLSGHGVGFQARASSEFSFTPKIGLSLYASLISNYVWGLKGTEQKTTQYTQRDFLDSTAAYNSTSETYDVVMLRFKNRYTGNTEFSTVKKGDPREKEGENAAKEFATFRLGISLNYYF